MTTSDEAQFPATLKILAAVCALVFVALPAAYFIRFGSTGPGDQDRWGQFGDFVGGTLNPVLGLITVCAILMTYHLQQVQMKLQVESMTDAAELNALTAALDATNIMIAHPCHTGERAVTDGLYAIARREALIREILVRSNMDPKMYMPIFVDDDEETLRGEA